MSQTLSMTAMVARLQQKTAIGLPTQACVDFLNEAFRKMNQMSKGGFVWQFKQTNLVVPAGGQVDIALPADFDPGKTAVLRANVATGFGGVGTMIPYAPMKDFVNEEHFQSLGLNVFSTWTWIPTFNSPLTFSYSMKLSPAGAYPTTGGTLVFFYHALVLPPLTIGANFFPTPDQFDSLIVDLAIAEVRNIYRMSGAMEEIQAALGAMAEMVDTYRTDRYDLAGLTDQMIQSQEKQLEKAK